MRLSVFLLLTCFLFLHLSCHDDYVKPTEDIDDEDKVKDEDLNDETYFHDPENIGEASLLFGLNLLHTLDKEESITENVLFSPLSIYTALNMASNAAEGNTLEEILKVLHNDKWSLDEINERQKALISKITDQSGHPVVNESNGLFYDPSRMNSNESYEELLRTYYDATIKPLDFSVDGKDIINDWVKAQTNEKIDEIIKDISNNEVAILLNAIYFRSDWHSVFNPAETGDRKFHLANGSSKTIPFMSKREYFRFFKNEAYMSLDLPFKDATFSMTLMAPLDETTIQDFIDQLTLGKLMQTYNSMQAGDARVVVPKMDLSYSNELSQTLKKLGIHDAFSENHADFPKLGEPHIGDRFFISKINHESVLTVNEKGTEGAAATSIPYNTTSQPIGLVFNRPFVIILRHIETNTPVFIGRIANPA